MASTSTSKKRKSGASGPANTAKKARLADAASTVQAILADPEAFTLPDEDTVKQTLVELAFYARSLEEDIAGTKPVLKSSEQLDAAAVKLSTAARSGIRKQMTWKPSCKTGSARWLYDGVCADPEVFGRFLGLDGPPTFKAKKMPKDQFMDIIGDLSVSVRYDMLSLTSMSISNGNQMMVHSSSVGATEGLGYRFSSHPNKVH
ncbi:hypothetical protein BD779DRAFT_409859 [Infundibulicybe gibba]|nr:hypothetical protein BD779DRAFT_409859 [Infundibulicybe gibba]